MTETKPVAPRIILASASPRRQALIGLLGVPVELRPADVEETALPGEQPVETARRLALAKSQAAAARGGSGLVVGGDTIVVDGGSILGKPRDPEEAREMLRRLRGREHEVITGLAVVDLSNGRRDVSEVRTRVRMRDYSDAEVAAYVQSGAPLDKAGAYGIQDTAFKPVERIEGCYLNVVGLPLCGVARAILRLGYALPDSPYSSGACHCDRAGTEGD